MLSKRQYDFNKLFKLIFAIVMVLSFVVIPGNVNALEGAVAKVDITEYATLAEAIEAAKDGGTVTLLSNVTENVVIPKGATVTIDLADYTLTNVSSHTIVNNGTLTIKGNENGTVDNITHGKGAVVNYGNFTLESGTLTRSMEAGRLDEVTGKRVNGGNSWYVVDNNGSGKENVVMTVKGGKIVNTSGFSSLIRNLEATLNIEGGELSNSFIALKNDDNGSMTMTGGKVTTTDVGGSAVQNWSEFTITGGTLVAESSEAAALSSFSWSDDFNQPKTVISENAIVNGNIQVEADDYEHTKYPEMIITGGEVNGDISVEKNATLTVESGKIAGKITSTDGTAEVVQNGGTFTKEPDASLIPEDKEVVKNEDGTFTIEYKSADYSALNAIVEKIKALDKSLYTEESIKNLETVLASVDYNKNINEQADVDKMVSNLNDAISNLVMKEVIENPSTYDGIGKSFVLAGVSLSGLLLIGLCLKNRKRFN